MFKPLLLLSFLIVFLLPVSTYAFSISEKTGTAITVDPYYDSANDVYMLEFDNNVVTRIRFTDTDSTYTTEYNVKEVLADPKFVGTHRFTCNSYYKSQYFDSNNNEVGKILFQATEIISPTCDSTSGSGAENETTTTTDCSTLICECIDQLKSVVSANGAILGNLDLKLTDILTKNTEIKTTLDLVNTNLGLVSTDIKNLHGEFKTDTVFDLPMAPVFDTVLDQNKPPMPLTSFSDTTTYFTDSGDAETPLALPLAPEPTTEWDTGKKDSLGNPINVLKETDLIKQNELTKSIQPVKDTILQKDLEKTSQIFIKDTEKAKQTFTKDSEITKQSFTQTENKTKETEKQNTNIFTKSVPITKDDGNYSLRWKQVEGVIIPNE